MKKEKRFGGKFIHFDNIIELLDFVNKNEDKGWSIIERNKEARKWTGNFSYKQAKEQIITGDIQYTQKFINGLKSIESSEVNNSQFGFDVEGDCYDIGSVVEGIPECCICQTQPCEKKHIRIIAALGFRDGTKESAIVNRGVAITHLVSSLMTQGYIVDFSVCFFCNRREERRHHGFILDLPRNMISVSSIAYVCSIQFFRIISLLVSDMIVGENWAGSCTGFKPDEFLEYAKKNTLYIEDDYDYDFKKRVDDYCRTPEKAIEYVKEKYNEFCEKN